MKNKEISRGIALVFVVLILGLFSAGICTAEPSVPLLISPMRISKAGHGK